MMVMLLKAVNRRKEERKILVIPLCSEVSIGVINNQPISSGRMEVCVKDVSIHGLRFVSSLRFPITDNLLLKFQTRMMDQLITLTGKIVWRTSNPLKPGVYEYGVELLHDDFSQTLFTKLYNDMSVWLKKISFVPGCRFCTNENCPLYAADERKIP
ncbi:PilZ domain-containing protein [Aneurinibacillus sp. REN35]|uniref:PilZ domain-containing protein n=1 Tax=Aneurinibacillus sp. REN35 TaxID=3237286 RepID=UPI003528DC91